MTAVEVPVAELVEEEIVRGRQRTTARRKRLLRRGKGCVLWVLSIATVIGLGTWFAVTMIGRADRLAGEQALADARAGGALLTAEDLGKLAPRTPEIEETTKLWRKAIEKIDVTIFSDPSYWKVPVIGVNRTDDGADPPDRDSRGHLQGEDLTAATQFAAQFDEAFDAARAARDSGAVANFSIPADSQPGVFYSGNSYHLLLLGTALRLRIETRLANGDVQGALDDVATMVAVSDATRYEPYDWVQRTRHQVIDSTVDLVERMLAAEDLDDDQLKRLAASFADRDEAEAFRLALTGSKSNFVDLLQRDDEEFKNMLRIERSSRTRGADLAKGLDIYRRMEQASEQGLVEAIGCWTAIGGELAKLGAEPSAQTRYPGTLMLIPQLGQQAQSHLQAEASVGLARTAIACERYRLAHGKLPAKLEDLTPDFLEKTPLDPCDGKPLRYVNDANGVHLYSIGPDLVDHGGGGAVSSGAAMFAPSDIVFRLKKSRANVPATQP